MSAARQKLDAENEALKKQVETLRREFYNLELEYKEGRASERAELSSLREQMRLACFSETWYWSSPLAQPKRLERDDDPSSYGRV